MKTFVEIFDHDTSRNVTVVVANISSLITEGNTVVVGMNSGAKYRLALVTIEKARQLFWPEPKIEKQKK